MKGAIYKAFTDHNRTVEDFLTSSSDVMVEIAAILTETFQKGRKLLLFGNGGSAADAQHMAAELVNRFRINRKAYPAVALTTDSSVLTSIGNDFGFDRVFARQVEALGRMDDAVMAFSTSGNSPNILEGVAVARRQGMITIGLTGANGQRLAKDCDYSLVVPSAETPRIQECHIIAVHVLCELVERELSK